ncbi:M23 family metallopeptidase [Bacillus dakarensis]|uniref:M23 family metallopeptidase n=1 Tax=Robertmurraya dakarensis TaxID=1926278 RepID=UPI000982631B|nr:M23 family metallopeptidase [Bacillus dakarensis]
MREEEKKQTSQDSSIKRFFKKRWAFPAIYIASAAIILTAVLWFQNSNEATDEQIDYEATDITGKEFNEPAVEVNRSMENFAMPVVDPDSVKIQKQFYDFESSKEEQEAALVFYNNTYHPNTGIDITMENGEAFEVVAALSGTVTNVQEDSLLGNVIEIEHDKGIVTQYQSVTDIDVKVGDQVEQGQTLAMAGKSLYNEEAGTHLHFEIRKDNVAVNPIDFFNKPLSALQEKDVAEGQEVDDSGKAESSEGSEEEDATTGEEPAEDEGKSEDDSTSNDESKDEEKSVDEDENADEKESEEKTDSSDA